MTTEQTANEPSPPQIEYDKVDEEIVDFIKQYINNNSFDDTNHAAHHFINFLIKRALLTNAVSLQVLTNQIAQIIDLYNKSVTDSRKLNQFFNTSWQILFQTRQQNSSVPHYFDIFSSI